MSGAGGALGREARALLDDVAAALAEVDLALGSAPGPAARGVPVSERAVGPAGPGPGMLSDAAMAARDVAAEPACLCIAASGAGGGGLEPLLEIRAPAGAVRIALVGATAELEARLAMLRERPRDGAGADIAPIAAGAEGTAIVGLVLNCRCCGLVTRESEFAAPTL